MRQSNRLLFQIHLALIAILIFSGCSSVPSVSDARKFVERQIQSQSNGLVRLVSFEKTNSQQFEVMGVRGYVLEYQTEIEFLNDAWWGEPFVAEQRSGPVGYWESYNRQLRGMKQVHRAQHVKVTGKIEFERTEKGWRAQDGNIY